MYQVKPLIWRAHKDMDGIYAAPQGLKWRYSIIVHQDGKVEFALLDQKFEYASGFPQFCISVSMAQKKAAKHYALLLERFIYVK